MISVMLKQEAYGFDNLADIADVELERDALALFTRQHDGHMGKWEYGSSLYAGDPAGGADLWAKMVSRPSDYYVTQADIKLVKWAVRQDALKTYFVGIRSFMEFGPGSDSSFVTVVPRFEQLYCFGYLS